MFKILIRRSNRKCEACTRKSGMYRFCSECYHLRLYGIIKDERFRPFVPKRFRGRG